MSDFNIKNGILKKYTGKDADVVIPDSVTEIGIQAFEDCRRLKSVTIPGSVTEIGDWAFSGCKRLTNITIPDSITKIGGDAFRGCSSLTSITIPDSVTKIGDLTFCDCTSLTNVTIHDSVTEIGYSAFHGCSGLTSVTIPDGVTEIGEGTFSCSGLTSVTIPDGITSIGKQAFSGCSGLTNITIPDSVTEVGVGAFYGCSGLTSITIPDSVMKIGDRAFSGCDKLSEVHISDLAKWCSIKFDWSSNPLEYAHNLYLNGEHVTDLVIPDGVAKICDRAFSGCSGLTSITIPDSVTEIGDRAFYDCSCLASVTIPDSVKKICVSLFSGCTGLTSVTVGSGVKKIERGAFAGCSSLKNVTLKNGKDLAWFTEKSGNYGPFCYSLSEEEMADTIREAAKWKKNKKEAFYEAYLVSDTRAAMLLAEKRKELDKYAKMRRMTADEVRDSMLSDLGLDAEGCKAYDLGNITVNVRMLSDFTFTVELPDGKASKSIPKKGADEKKYEEANKDFSEIKKNVKKIWKNRSDVILSDFITGKEREASYWIKTYSGNPVLRHIACLIVWEQNGAYFTKTKDGTVDADGAPYELGEGAVRVAHPMEMSAEEVSEWQKYFTDRVLKQPFAQIWERVYKAEDISEDRYRDCPILFFALQGAVKHGFDEKLDIPGCKVETKWTSEKAPNGNSVSYCNITSFRIEKYSRAVNHAIAYLDRTTVLGRIAKDDISVMESVQGCNAAQITDYTDAANNAKATNVLAALLEYKNKNFPDATPFDVFTLDW